MPVFSCLFAISDLHILQMTVDSFKKGHYQAASGEKQFTTVARILFVEPLKIMIMKRNKIKISVESSFSSDFIWKLLIN